MNEVLKTFKLAAYSAVGFQHLNTFEVRSKQRIPQNAKTAVAIIFPYYNKSAFSGNVSAYCAVADYHIVVMEQLKSIISALQSKYPHNIFVPFVDSSPIDEVDMAVKAGLGVKGENSLLITEKWGSFVFIGEIVTDLEWETVLYDYSHCIGCGLCAKHCPGKAIEKTEICNADEGNGGTAEKGAVAERNAMAENGATAKSNAMAESIITAVSIGTAESSAMAENGETTENGETAENIAISKTHINCQNCASFISQKKQELTAEQTAILQRAKTVFGCDICQKVCPHNRKLLDGTAPASEETNLFSGDIFHTVTEENAAQVYKQRAFGFRGLKVLERNLELYNNNSAE